MTRFSPTFLFQSTYRKLDIPDDWMVEPPKEWWLVKHPKWVAKFGKDYAAKYEPANYR